MTYSIKLMTGVGIREAMRLVEKYPDLYIELTERITAINVKNGAAGFSRMNNQWAVILTFETEQEAILFTIAESEFCDGPFDGMIAIIHQDAND